MNNNTTYLAVSLTKNFKLYVKLFYIHLYACMFCKPDINHCNYVISD
jgi:hypothetical protein